MDNSVKYLELIIRNYKIFYNNLLQVMQLLEQEMFLIYAGSGHVTYYYTLY